jgi:hypothetical protein
MRQSMEKCFEYDTDLHMLFIDFRQAFDSVKRREVLNALERFGVPQKLVRLAGLTMKYSRAKALIGGKTSRAFQVSTEVLQGDSLSAVLFNLALDVVMKEQTGRDYSIQV